MAERIATARPARTRRAKTRARGANAGPRNALLQFVDAVPSAVLVVAPDTLRIVHGNAAALRELARSLDELRALALPALCPGTPVERYAELIAPLVRGTAAEAALAPTVLRGDGLRSLMQGTLRMVEQGATRQCLLFLAPDPGPDTAGATLPRLAHMARARRVMAQCNHVLVHATDEATMLRQMCEVLAGSGGYLQAWVGLAQDDARKSIAIGASVGYDPGYIEGRRLTWGIDGDRGVMGKVIATGKPHIAQNILTGTEDASRRARALARGYQSSATLPLVVDGRVIGGVGLYAAEPDAFDAEELGLLAELADDMAFGLNSLRMRRARELAEEALRDSESKLRAVFEQAAVGITRVDLEGVIVDVNQTFCRMVGYARDELIGKTVGDITHAQDRGVGAGYRRQIARGRSGPVIGEKRFVRKDGSVLWARRTMSVSRDASGEPQFIISVVEDISERKRVERRFELTFNQAAVGIVHTALPPDRRYLMVNRRFCEMIGYSPEELYGMHGLQLAHPDDSDSDGDLETRLLAGEIDTYCAERRYIRKDGGVIWTSRTVSLVRNDEGEPEYCVRVIEDITARKELEERFRATFEQAAVGLMHSSLDRRILTVNRKFCEMIGYTADELTRKGVKSIHHPDDSDADQPLERKLISGEIDTFTFEKRYIRRDGSIMWASRTVSLARGADGTPLYFIRVIQDITDRKEAERRYQALFEAAPVGMLRSALDRSILEVNPKLCEITGYGPAELLTMKVSELVHPDHRGTDEGNYLEQMLQGQRATYSAERLYQRKDGTPVWVNRTVSVVRDAAGKPQYFLRIIEDASERRRSREALRESERFATATIDALSTHICVIDEAGAIIAVNKAWRSFAEENGVAPGYRWEGVNYLEATERAAGRGARDSLAVARGIRQVLAGDRGEFSYTYACHAPTRQRWFTMKAMRFPGSGPRRAVVSHEDITRQMLSERRRMMEHAITRVVAEATTVQEAMPMLLATLCQAMDWAYGAYWAWSEEKQTLTRREFWTETGADVAPRNKRPWVEVNLNYSGGLLRRAWLGKQVTWVEDVTRDATFRRGQGAAEMGLRSAFSFPVTVGPEAIGVLEFFGREPRQPDEMLLQITRSIGSQIGQFIQRKQIEETLKVSDERFRVAFNQASLGISMSGTDLRYLQVNDKYCEIVGYGRDELASMRVTDVLLQQDVGETAAYREKLMTGEIESYQRERELRRKDGTTVWVNLVVTLIRDAQARPLHFVAMIQDVSERKRGEEALRESEEKFRQLADNVPEAFWIVDARTWELIYLNPAGRAMIEEPLGKLSRDTRNWLRLVHPEDRLRVRAAKRRLLANEGYDEEFRIVLGNGTVRWIHDLAFPVRDAEGRVYRIAGISADVTPRKEAEQKLVHLAHYDALTGLPNRVLFYDRLKLALAQARRNRWVIAVIFLDLDRFKNVNDTLGHAVGDELLGEAAARLQGCVRAGDTVGRLGGDEFAIVLSNISGQHDASIVAQKIMSAFAEPFVFEGGEVFVTASIGITLYPNDSTDQDTLIRNADTAMYRAKDLGRNSCQYYAPEMNARALEKLGMESSLRRAIERREFLLYYQPKVSLATGEVTGVEALMRWRHPDRGLVSPAEFMPVLEETGLIVPTGEWVIRAACEQIRAWQQAGVRAVPVAVNLSARQFQAKDLAETVRRILEECGVEGRLLELEITESSLVGNTEEAVHTLAALGALGIRIAIDDFGTGYSNLNYLKRFPLDALKIDSSFVRDVITDIDDAAITRAIITMAHYLELSVIAEGVETDQQLSFLHANGCDEIQGYYFSRPLPAEDCGALLAGGRRLQHASIDGESEAPAVLLVDDDEDALTLLKRDLTADGYPVLTATDAREGLKLLDLHDIRVVVSDYSMPGMSGVDFLERVKALHPDTVRIMLTSHADLDTVTRAVNKTGIYRFVSKDWGSAHLRADIRQALVSTLQVGPATRMNRRRAPPSA